MKEAKRKMKAELEETKRKINDEFDAKIQKLKQDSKRGPSTTIRAPHTTAAPATLGATTAPPDEDQEVLVTQAGDITPAVWEVDFAPTLKSKNTLVYRSGSMVLDTDYSDGSSASHEVLERPVDVPNARRFDLQADSDRSEYITLSESGDVNYFSWEGTQFENASAIAISAEFMVVGANPVARDCVAKRLSEASKETIRLYEQLPSRTIPNSFVWALPAPACTTPGCKPPRAFMPSVA